MIRRIALFFAALLFAGNLRATVVERVVAVVDDRAILLSELVERARPYVVQLNQKIPPGAQRAAQTSQMYKAVLEKMVDEEIMRRAASQARLSVSAEEVDESIAKVARQARLTPAALVQEAVKSGLTEAEYRIEMRRQVLEAKLLNLRVLGRIRVTGEDLKSAYRRIVLDERRRLPFRAAWIVMRAPRGPEGAARRALASRVAAEAAAGADFGVLARRHSDDARTRGAGGLLPKAAPGALPREVDRGAVPLDVGQVSSTIRVGDSLYVVKMLERDESDLPTFEEAQAELNQRVYLDKMTRARRHWLDGLKKRSHVEVRM